MKRRLICMFLVGVMFFAELDFHAVAATVNAEIVSDVPVEGIEESTETLDSDIWGSEEIAGTETETISETETINETESFDFETMSESDSEYAEEETLSGETEQQEEDFTIEAVDSENIEIEETDIEETDIEKADSELTENEIQISDEDIKTDTSSSEDINSALEDYIESFQDKYPEGSVWNSSYDGGKQCFGFAMLIADKVFGCHPQNTSIRRASDGTVSNGWTCYYVTSSNCDDLSVEPGDIIDAPTSASASHTAMVSYVSGSNITCVQCNLSGNCKIYWTQNFNYNRKNATLSQIYSRFGVYGRVRLWKPSEELKKEAVKEFIEIEEDEEAPKVGEVTIGSSTNGLTFSCAATDNIGITEAWAIITDQNGKSRRFEASVSGGMISGIWSSVDGFSADSKDFVVTVYAMDAAGNIGSNSTSVKIEINMTMSPRESTIKVGEKTRINVQIGETLYEIDETELSYDKREENIVVVDYGGWKYSQYAEIEGLKPGTVQFTFMCKYHLDRVLPDNMEAPIMGYTWMYANVYVIPDTPIITSIENQQYQYDCIHYTPVDYAEAYSLYRMRAGIDSDYELVDTFVNDGSNSYTIEHPADGSTYYYKLVAKAAQTTNAKGEIYFPTSEFSNVLTSTTYSFVPTNASAMSNRENEIYVTWDEVIGASGYEIYRYTDEAAEETEKKLLAVLDASKHSYLDTDVDGGIQYYYDIYAVDVVNEKGQGVTVSCIAKGIYEEKVFYTVKFQTGFEQIYFADEEVEKGKCVSKLSDFSALMKMDGYEFIGWYTKPDGKGEFFTSETPVTSDLVVYAYWKKRETEKTGEFWIAPIGEQRYTGKAIKPEVRVYDGDILLVQGTDYTVSYKNNVKVCDANASSKVPTVVVKGKKNYSHSKEVPFSIVAVDLNDSGIVAEDLTVAYTGKNLKLQPVVSYNGKKLKYNTDYTISYSESLKDIGKYSIKIIGKGGYTGEKTVSVTITDKILLNKVKVNKIPNQIYDGTRKTPALIVKSGRTFLSEYTGQNGTGDYTVRYLDNRDVGTATVILTAVEGSRYAGSKTVTFKITGEPISKAIAASIGNQTYTGKEIMPMTELTVKEKNSNGATEVKRLVEGIDYTLIYSNNINVGTGKILVTGKGKYTGSKTVTFKIVPYDLSKLPVKASYESEKAGYFISVNSGEPVVYRKGKTEASVTVGYSDYVETDGETVLQTHVLSENDYKVTYKNANNISLSGGNKPQVIITGKGNYKGTITSESAKFEIIRADMGDMTAKAIDVPYSPKAGNFAKTKVTLYDVNGKKLTAGQDYDKKFVFYNVTDYFTASGNENSMNLQTAASCNIKIQDKQDFEAEMEKAETGNSQKITLLDKEFDIPSAYQIICVKVSAKEMENCNYFGNAYAFYRISTSNLGKCTVKVTGTYVYNGAEQVIDKDDLVVTVGSGKNKKELVYGKDYLIDQESYINNKKVGNGSVSIYGIGSYYGTKKVSFRIRAKSFFGAK